MTDVFSPLERSAVMRAVPSKGTSLELRVRRAVREAGFGYRLQADRLPGRPDLIFPGRHVAVFTHGCFWHGHDCARGSRVPAANRQYWLAKVARNRARDERVTQALREAGWRVAVIWECSVAEGVTMLVDVLREADARNVAKRTAQMSSRR